MPQIDRNAPTDIFIHPFKVQFLEKCCLWANVYYVGSTELAADLSGSISTKDFFFEDISSFCGAIETPVLDFCWRLPWVSKPGWIPCMLSCLCDPQIHLWCDTCWLYRGQHGSQVFLIHILTDVSASIGGSSGQTGARTHGRLCRTKDIIVDNAF